MRGMVAGLRSPVPMETRLPAVLRDDEFMRRFIAAFDDVLAPVLATLDGLHAYFDPQLAPPDFVDWLSEWVGVRMDEEWSVEQRRVIVSRAVAVHRGRGTLSGIAEAVRLTVTGAVDVEVRDNGGVEWAPSPGAKLPGRPEPLLDVRVTTGSAESVDVRRLDAIIASVKPAHIPHRIEVITPSMRSPAAS
jgi:phage tail-like protein